MAKATPFSFAYLSEILSSPAIKPLVQRLHPSAVLGALKSTFDDMVIELGAAFGEQRLPDVNDLIERIRARLENLLEVAEPLVLDARGRVFPNGFERLAPPAVQEGTWILSEPQSDYSRRQDAARERDVRLRLTRLAGCESAAVFADCESARVAILHALALSGRKLVVARRDLFEKEDGSRLEDAFSFFPSLQRREIGACNSVTLRDYERAIDAETGLVWRAFGRWSQDGRSPLASDVARLKGIDGRSFSIIGDLEFAPLIDLSDFFDAPIPTVGERLKNGFDLVLCDGAQLIGGPSCGLVFGSRSSIDSILAAPAAPLAKLNRVAYAILAKTLAIYESRDAALESIPPLRTLSTSLANLQSRAERLATLLEHCECVQIARVVEGRAVLCPNAPFGTSPTRIVEVRLRGFSPAEFAAKLETTSPKLLVRWTRDAVHVDMKTLLPEQDIVVSELFEQLSRQMEKPAGE
ncbi:MAG: hypothetical protein IIU43_09870 [Thermoguttaceae bacterium]|nr:hypothetical protein [Thermoguttaceae bacterium]MBQ4081252.1 hypothetical protein [Thermoguttaceae bacterium]MBQ5367769.1 hypothetical protein [Thermoguttaceae bacterium]